MKDGGSPSARTLFMGSPDYAAVILSALAAYGQTIIAVVTQPDKQVGRGKHVESPPVKIMADRLGLRCFQPKNLTSDEFMSHFFQLQPELVIVAAYGKILREEILSYPKFGCVNVHASLLPRWRGASPIQAAILHGDIKSGVTVMKMDEGIDTGDIIARRSIAIEEQETTTSLMDKLAHLGAELLIETLPGYLSGEIEPSPQEEDGATYAGMIKKKDGLIHFDQPADQIERMVRALDPWPNAYFDWDGKYVKIFSAKVLPSKNLASGQRGVVDQYPVIGTATADLMLLEVQVPGKNRFDGKVFLNGARNW